VTGANQGLGRALVEGLAAGLTPHDRVLLTGRRADVVQAAAAALHQGYGAWFNIPSKVAQVAAVRALADLRRQDDLAHGRLIAALSRA
jgi:NAD(P)-dependent dehydrogenase (short-subunit alcohol dehydrogenase family)